MFKVEGTTIKLTRGDKAIIEFSIDNYTFVKNDKIKFKIYKKLALNQPPVFKKTIIIEKEQTTMEIILTSEETKIGIMSNRPITYWYEIELNDNETPVGYDDDGATLLILYPEGADDNDV